MSFPLSKLKPSSRSQRGDRCYTIIPFSSISVLDCGLRSQKTSPSFPTPNSLAFLWMQKLVAGVERGGIKGEDVLYVTSAQALGQSVKCPVIIQTPKTLACPLVSKIMSQAPLGS